MAGNWSSHRDLCGTYYIQYFYHQLVLSQTDWTGYCAVLERYCLAFSQNCIPYSHLQCAHLKIPCQFIPFIYTVWCFIFITLCSDALWIWPEQ